jgi:hypothetical protein
MPRSPSAALAYVPPKLQSTRAAAPQPTTRGQSNEETPTVVRIPTPEELGIGRPDESFDWSVVERKLDAAGATGFQVERTTTGYRFTCQVPSGPVTGRGATKPEAVRNALAQLSQ